MLRSTEKIDQNVLILHGVQLDRLTLYGPRGGKRTYWRSAASRAWKGAWYSSKIEAARVSPGYLGPSTGVVTRQNTRFHTILGPA